MPSPPTLAITISGLVSLLAARLGVNTSITDYWNYASGAELELYIRAAIREFQCLTGFWKDQIPFTVAADTAFYDVSTLDSSVSYNVTDLNICAQAAYHLLEFVTGSESNFINTDQFVTAALVNALDQRREEMLGRTRMVVTDFQMVSPSLTNGRLTLANSILQVHRFDWQDSVSTLWGTLDRADELAASAWLYQWQNTAALPGAYSSSIAPPFVLQLIPIPVNSGTAEFLATVSNPYAGTPAPGGSATILNLPDDSTWVLTWGILASMLDQDAKSRDYQRAAWARRRFEAGIQVLSGFPLVEQAEIGGVSVNPSSLRQLDLWQPGWRNVTPAEPSVVAVGGRNLVAVSPVPDNTYDFTMDVFCNSPASGANNVTIAIPSDIVTAILDNGVHLATFKIGGEQFQQTIGLYKNFLDVAQNYVGRLRAQTINFDSLRDIVFADNANVKYEVAVGNQPEAAA